MFEKIKWLHVESSTRCNAWCASCQRNNYGFGINKNLVIEDLDIDILYKTMEKMPNLESIQLCGNYGDPIAAKNIVEQLEVISSFANIKRLQIHTNGSLRTKEWWADLAKHGSKRYQQFDVEFAIDGIGDVHEYYRQGTNYHKVIENAKSFIDNGGSAVWQFIPFAHNEHQIKDCIKLSQQLGFSRFNFLKNARLPKKSYDYQTGKEKPIKAWFYNSSMNRWIKEKTIVTNKDCMHLSYPSAFLRAAGVVTPCCYINNIEIYDVNIQETIDSKNYLPICLNSCGK